MNKLARLSCIWRFPCLSYISLLCITTRESCTC